MVTAADSIQRLLDAVEGNTITARATIVFTSFRIYDNLLTLDDEIELIWKSPGSFPSIVYLILRYFSLAYLMFNVYGTINTHLSPAFCDLAFTIRSWVSTIIVPMADISIILRIFALYNNNIKVGVFIVILWMVQIASVVAAAILDSSLNSVDNPLPGILPGCFPIEAFRVKVLLQGGIITIAVQVVYLGLSMNVLLRTLWQYKTRLIQALFRDAVVYCVMITVVFSLNLWLFFFANDSGVDEIGQIGLVALVSCLASRFVLDLRKRARQGFTQSPDTQFSTINWAIARSDEF